MAALPMHLVAEVGGLRIGIVHGDAMSLAGWSFGHDALETAAARTTLEAVRRAARIDLFASTHTCLAVLRDFQLRAGRLTIINNGAAGMPNFSGGRFGLVSRIAAAPSPHRPLYGIVRDGVHIDAIPLPYDSEAFLRRFLARWPAGSAAHTAIFDASQPDRIIRSVGPHPYEPMQVPDRPLPQPSPRSIMQARLHRRWVRDRHVEALDHHAGAG
jgi:hypothetical protein